MKEIFIWKDEMKERVLACWWGAVNEGGRTLCVGHFVLWQGHGCFGVVVYGVVMRVCPVRG